ncbi:tellurite resistance TerB family protein [Kaarinaea lacus]
MSIHNLLNQFMGATNDARSSGNVANGIGNTLNKLSSSIPGGLAGGAAAGGIMALLVSSKSARKIAGTAATYGGAALLGGLAFKAFKNWQKNNNQQVASHTGAQHLITKNDSAFNNGTLSNEFQITLIKAMIAAAKADGHIDELEQHHIFKVVEQMDLPMETKGILFDLLQKPISIDEIIKGAVNIEQRTELYLASCLVINPDHPSEQSYLDQLARALQLPKDLARELKWQAQEAVQEAA